jgi:hypothetical protein
MEPALPTAFLVNVASFLGRGDEESNLARYWNLCSNLPLLFRKVDSLIRFSLSFTVDLHYR